MGRIVIYDYIFNLLFITYGTAINSYCFIDDLVCRKTFPYVIEPSIIFQQYFCKLGGSKLRLSQIAYCE